jgi:hypothetical protein
MQHALLSSAILPSDSFVDGHKSPSSSIGKSHPRRRNNADP